MRVFEASLFFLYKCTQMITGFGESRCDTVVNCFLLQIFDTVDWNKDGLASYDELKSLQLKVTSNCDVCSSHYFKRSTPVIAGLENHREDV